MHEITVTCTAGSSQTVSVNISYHALCSALVDTEHGFGFWDAETGELRMIDRIHISPRPLCFFAASAEQASLFFQARASRRAYLLSYYAAPGDKGN